MPRNYPNNIRLVDKGFTLYNNRFDKPVNITVIYNVKFWSWLWAAVLKRKPLFQCTFVGNAGNVTVNTIVREDRNHDGKARADSVRNG